MVTQLRFVKGHPVEGEEKVRREYEKDLISNCTFTDRRSECCLIRTNVRQEGKIRLV